jgi:hypothetical protein
VHGPLLLTPDADAIVIDPSFAGSVAGDLLLATAARYGLAAEWSIGCALALADVPRHAPEIEPAGMRRWEAFCGRGRAFALAEYVIAGYGHGGCLDAATIGRANVSASRDLGVWREWGAGAAVQEQLKDLWLVLVAYGQPPQRPV